MGGGFEIMLATDIRIAAPRRWSSNCPNRSTVSCRRAARSVRLVAADRLRACMEIMLTAERFSADDMLAKGVVNRVADSDQVELLAYEMRGTRSRHWVRSPSRPSRKRR